MKKVVLMIAAVVASVTLLAQAPQTFFYQAVARDGVGSTINNTAVSFQITIVQGSPTGTDVYQEIHPVTTSDHGVVGMEIGTGLIVSGDFSTIAWGSDQFYIRTEFDPAGGFAFQLMGTSQLISVPYALHSRTAEFVDDADADPSNEIQTLTLVGSDLSISGGNTIALPSGGGGNTLDAAYDQGGAGLGRIISADAGAVEIIDIPAAGIGLDATTSNTGSVAIAGESTSAANAFSAIQAITNSSSSQASAIVGNSDGTAWGVSGQITAGASAEAGIYGSNFRTNGGHGVLGIGFNGTVGMTDYRAGFGIYGENFDAIGSTANLAIGVAGIGYYGVVGEDRYLGTVFGAYGMFSNGDMGASGLKLFTIDHPADPYNKTIRHFCLESNEVLNVYRGNVVLDADGNAQVELPDYFESINTNYSYQLTPIGGFAPLFVAHEIENGVFHISGGEAGMKVSWTVQAERNDPYLQQYPEKRADVVEKSEREKGKLLIPALYGAGDDSALFSRRSRTIQTPLKLR